METLLSYHSSQEIKDKHIAMAKEHERLDMLVAGTYGTGRGKAFKGCSVGCFAHEINPKRKDLHAVVAESAGWPEWFVRLNDIIFEGLPNDERAAFHIALRELVPVGVDLEPVRHLFALRRIDRLISQQRKDIGKHGGSIDTVINGSITALEVVRRCHEAEIGGNMCDWSAAESAARAARAAAMAAARAAVWAAAWAAESAARAAAMAAAWAAESAARAAWAAESAVWSAESAVWSAWAAWAAEAAEARRRRAAWAAFQSERDDLLDILRAL